MKRLEDQILSFTSEILLKLGFEAEVNVEADNEQILVEINCQPAGLLIGRQGQNLRALERVLQVAFYSKISAENKIIRVDVGGFRGRRTQMLEDLAQKAMDEVLTTSQPETLLGLTASERKAIHLKVSKNPNLTSESQGTGINRVLIIKPKP